MDYNGHKEEFKWIMKCGGELPVMVRDNVRLNDREIESYYKCGGDCFNLNRLEKEVRKIIESNFKLPVFLLQWENGQGSPAPSK